LKAARPTEQVKSDRGGVAIAREFWGLGRCRAENQMPPSIRNSQRSAPFPKTTVSGQTLFTREGSVIEPSAEFKEGKGLEARTRANALLLSVVAQFNGNIAGEIMQWMERFRRDQVWFVEKDEFGASQLFSLAEFKVRKEAKFGKEYLLGQFGAVPHLRDFQGTLTHAK
jgi:hypothetical protein